jgi:hypothetical protein
MKLHDLAAPQKTQQIAKVMESHFGSSVAFDQLSPKQAQAMLQKVRGLIAEQRRNPSFHSSEQNPAYLKLMMMEQGLAAATQAPQQTPQQAAAAMTLQRQEKRKQSQAQLKEIDDQIKALQTQRQQVQQQMNSPVGESKIARRLREASEVQQAQVVLASKDMVDQVQKMIETATSIQFKDLPALVDQIRNEIGYDQATQFNQDATTALSGLVQNLQQSKGQLEGALGVVTGQAPQIPGQDLGAAPAADLGADLGAELPPVDGEEELDIDVDAEEEPSSLETTLGRGKR